MYPDPETFNPDRWLSPRFPTYREPLTQYPNLDGYSQFGFGRRVCQGIPVAEQDLFLSIGGMAWAFDIRKKIDTHGKEIPVHWNDYTPLLIAKPAPFLFDLNPRDEAKKLTLRENFAAMADEEEEEEEEESLNSLADEKMMAEGTRHTETAKPQSEEQPLSISKTRDAELEVGTELAFAGMRSIPGA